MTLFTLKKAKEFFLSKGFEVLETKVKTVTMQTEEVEKHLEV